MILLWCSAVCSRRLALYRRLAGIVLTLVGFAGSGYGVHASISQSVYFRLKFGSLLSEDLDSRHEAAVRADQLYGHNYYLSMLLAEDSWNIRDVGSKGFREVRVRNAAYWTERGLSQNPFRRELRWKEVLLVELESPLAARDLWQDYVTFAFWDAWNLSSLVVLMANAGDLEEAMKLMQLLQGKSQYEYAMDAVQNAFRGHKARPGISSEISR